MIKTLGLSHISLEVKDLDRSLKFYREMFGVAEYFRDEKSLQVKGPGIHDVLAFELAEESGNRTGINHFGFRLSDPGDMEAAIATARKIGAEIVRTGEFSPGYPYLYVLDPDGYEIEIWYE